MAYLLKRVSGVAKPCLFIVWQVCQANTSTVLETSKFL